MKCLWFNVYKRQLRQQVLGCPCCALQNKVFIWSEQGNSSWRWPRLLLALWVQKLTATHCVAKNSEIHSVFLLLWSWKYFTGILFTRPERWFVVGVFLGNNQCLIKIELSSQTWGPDVEFHWTWLLWQTSSLFTFLYFKSVFLTEQVVRWCSLLKSFYWCCFICCYLWSERAVPWFQLQQRQQENIYTV